MKIFSTDSKALCKKDTWEFITEHVDIVLCTEMNHKQKDDDGVRRWVKERNGLDMYNVNMSNFLLFCSMYSKTKGKNIVFIPNAVYERIEEMKRASAEHLYYTPSGPSLFEEDTVETPKSRKKKNQLPSREISDL